MVQHLNPGECMSKAANKAIDAALDQARSQRIGGSAKPTHADRQPTAPAATGAAPAPSAPRTTP